jgi:hypothetical protein
MRSAVTVAVILSKTGKPCGADAGHVEPLTTRLRSAIDAVVSPSDKLWGVGHKATIQMRRPDLGVCARAATLGVRVRL